MIKINKKNATNAIRLLKSDPWLFIKRVKRILRKPHSDYDWILNLKIREWLTYKTDKVKLGQADWFGHKIYKSPLDLWVYQEIIFEKKPDVIIEIGSFEGGSTFFFAQLFDLMGSRGKVISVDIDRKVYKAKHKRIIEVTGDSSSKEVFEKVKKMVKGKKVMVIHDGDHRASQVIKDLRLYASLVTKGQYLIVEDGIIDLFTPEDSIGSFDDGPLVAIEEFLKENKAFVCDKSRERYLVTQHPMGFLLKVK